MKRTLFSLISLLSIAAMALLPAVQVHAGVNDFQIVDFQQDFYLSRDSESRSTLKTKERITAAFPASDQNHGLERAIPKSYQGHPTHLNVASVTNESGTNLEYSTSSKNGNEVLRIGDKDTYVHGRKTYVITYSQRDVTLERTPRGASEFYWDTNGTQWAVPINSLTVRLHIDQSLQSRLDGNYRCYKGTEGSRSECQMRKTENGFTLNAANLRSSENATMAVGFTSNTFAAYQPTLFERITGIWLWLLSLLWLPAAGLIIWFSIRYTRIKNRRKEQDPIVPEYIPPSNASVSTSAALLDKSAKAFAAQLLDLAVRHYIKIYQTREKSTFKNAGYELELIRDPGNLREEELELLRDLFGEPTVGAKLNMDDLKSGSFASKLGDNPKKAQKAIEGSYGLRAKDAVNSKWFNVAGAIALVAAILTLSPWLFAVAIVAFVCAYTLRPLTDPGLALVRYLKGLEQYIKVAETERLKMLQSPEGAAKVGASVDGNDTRQLIKLYERVLPYAVIFGQEKEWNKQLGEYYTSAGTSPDWYAGNYAAFNAAAFASSMSDFNTAAAYSDPTSSSSGGAGGGGASGGGGGGGGGGGW